MTLLFAAALTVATFTPRDTAVIDAAIAVVFPDVTHRLLVVNETQAVGMAASPEAPPLAHEIDVLNSERHSIRSLDLKRELALVNPGTLPTGSDDQVMVTLPAFSADGSTALEVFDVAHPTSYGVSGRRESILLRNEKGGWVLSGRWSEPTWSSPATHDGPFRVGGDVKAPLIQHRVEPA